MNGILQKTKVDLQDEVKYTLQLEGEEISMNDYINKAILLEWNGDIFCSSCSKKIKKTFGDGY